MRFQGQSQDLPLLYISRTDVNSGAVTPLPWVFPKSSSNWKDPAPAGAFRYNGLPHFTPLHALFFYCLQFIVMHGEVGGGGDKTVVKKGTTAAIVRKWKSHSRNTITPYCDEAYGQNKIVLILT